MTKGSSTIQFHRDSTQAPVIQTTVNTYWHIMIILLQNYTITKPPQLYKVLCLENSADAGGGGLHPPAPSVSVLVTIVAQMSSCHSWLWNAIFTVILFHALQHPM